MKRFLMILVFALVPNLSFADVPTEAELMAQVKAMPMPSLEGRLKARAAAFRLFSETAKTLGFDDTVAQNAHGVQIQYASLRTWR